jgi:hypothetical protein
MIKKSVFVGLLLLILYGLLVFVKPSLSASQNQWQDNIIKAQKYQYYEGDTIKNIIVGSSLANRIIDDSLPQVTNLSFVGHSIYDGFSVLLQGRTIPKRVFVEMNNVFRPGSSAFTSSLNSPILYNARKIIPSLREDKQPIGLLGKYINDNFTKKAIRKIKHFVLKAKESKSNPELFSKMLAEHVNVYSKIPQKQLIYERFYDLKKIVDQLEKRGSTVIFFEMPVNGELCNLPLATTIRQNFYENFSPEKYAYIPVPDCSVYKTMDGIHLSRNEAIIYTSYFKDQIKNYLN